MSETQKPVREIGWEAVAINAAFEKTGTKFTTSNQETLAAFGREVAFDDDGNPFAMYDREVLPLADALVRWAADTDGVCDRRTLPRQVGGGRVVTLAKSDMTVAEKVEFIRVNGGQAYESLPYKSEAVTSEIRTKEDWYRLPVKERVRLTAKDSSFFERLPNTPSDQPKGGFINHAALAKHRATRPASR